MDRRDNQFTLFTWKISEFHKLHWRNKRAKKYSPSFSLTNDRGTQFALFYIPPLSGWSTHARFGVMLKKMGLQKAQFQVRFWIEDKQHQMYTDFRISKAGLDVVGGEYEVAPITRSRGERLLHMTYKDNLSLRICCEITPIKFVDAESATNTHDLLREKRWTRYLDRLLGGVLLKIGGKEFRVEESILICQVEHFANELASNFTEGATKEIDIPDFTPETGEAFVRWLYLGEINSMEDPKDLLVFADKYCIDDLTDQCHNMLKGSLSDENVIEYLIAVSKHISLSFENIVLNYLANKEPAEYMKVFLSNDWQQYSRENWREAAQTLYEFYSRIS